jgi:hypothetical protein
MLFCDRVIELLCDGQWHFISSLATTLNQSNEVVEEVLRFCGEFGIVDFGGSIDQVRVEDRFRRLFE